MFVHFFLLFRLSATAPLRPVRELSNPTTPPLEPAFEARCGDFIRIPPLVAALRTAV